MFFPYNPYFSSTLVSPEMHQETLRRLDEWGKAFAALGTATLNLTLGVAKPKADIEQTGNLYRIVRMPPALHIPHHRPPDVREFKGKKHA